MDDLVQWFGEQLDEDERTARAASGLSWLDADGWLINEDMHLAEIGDGPTLVHITAHDPARVLREIDAKRQLLTLHSVSEGHECSTRDAHGDIDHCTWVMESEACTTARLLALPYADRPGYLEKWRP